jgi:hypothetical protein
VIAVVEKAGDVASVGKDLLMRWAQGVEYQTGEG